MDDLKQEYDKHQTVSCGAFYANICAFDSDTILDLVDMPPAAPPPPIAPLNELTQVPIKRVMAAGGLDDNLDITTALTHCTDNGAETPCSALDYERPVRHTHIQTRSYTHTSIDGWKLTIFFVL